MADQEAAPPSQVVSTVIDDDAKLAADELVEVVPTSDNGNVLVTKYACESLLPRPRDPAPWMDD